VVVQDKRESVYFECMTAEEAVVQGQCTDADVVIVDPPRKGLDEDVIRLLTNTHESAKATSNY
jgi:tRNA/tmRNA/rRNA uracil-C5-methylase (TrmA/RlmC/RlmD family)